LTDFGFATFLNPVSGLKVVLGSPLYMAPEIVKEQNYNEKVDIWSIGVMAHILLTGCPPFCGKTKEEIYKAITTSEPRFGRVREKLSRDAVDFTLKCLEKDPKQRPTASELLVHPFIVSTKTSKIDSSVALEIANDLTTFYKQSVFQSGIISFLTNIRGQQTEFDKLKKMFLALDTS
jgi:serine/threonine protein kinase